MAATQLKEQIWQNLAVANYKDFFITAEITMEDLTYPSTLDAFIHQKLELIQEEKITGRKFAFKEGRWRIYLTFFPRNAVVNERYALKNKVFKDSSKSFNR